MRIALGSRELEQDHILNTLFRLSIICCTVIAMSTVYKLASITSFLFYLSFFLNFAAFIICVQRKTGDLFLHKAAHTLFLIIAVGFISVLSLNISFNYLKKYIIYFTTLSCYFVAAAMIPSKKTIHFLLYCNFALAIVYIVRAQAPGAYINADLWLFFSNPNFAGIWLFMTAILLGITAALIKHKLLKIILSGMTAYVAFLSYQSGARNVWLSLLFAALIVPYCMISKKKQFSKKTIFAVLIFPLLFALVYLFVVDRGGFGAWLEDRVVSEGKSINSRYMIWNEALSYYKMRPIFGAYRIIQGGKGSFQLHNTHIDTLAAYGTVGFVLFISYLNQVVRIVNYRGDNIRSMLALAGFLVMVVLGTGEASLYSTGMGMYIYVSSFLMLSSYYASKEQ